MRQKQLKIKTWFNGRTNYQLTRTVMQKYLIPAVLIASVLIVGWFMITGDKSVGSVSQTSEYLATTTGAFASSGGLQLMQLKNGWGSLGSIVVTVAAVGQINVYDATTSDANLRSSDKSTTSIQRVNLPASVAAGTYTFDIIMTDGILVETTGTAPTSTITYR